MKKVIVYLDQNFMGDIVEFAIKDSKKPLNSELKVVFDILKAGVDADKIIAPKSPVHERETAKNDNEERRKQIFSYFGYLSQSDFASIDDIRDKQFVNALLSFYGHKPLFSDNEIAFRENPDKRLQKLNVTVRHSNSFLKKQNKVSSDDIAKIKEGVTKKKTSFSWK